MSEIRVDTISEKTSANGVSIDGLTIKDGGITATTGAIVFNEASADVDFRVESNGDANTLGGNGGTDRVGIKTNAPTKTLGIGGDGLVSLEGSSNALTFYDSSALKAYITSQSFGDHNGDGLGLVTAGDEPIKFFANGALQWTIETTGHLIPGANDHGIYLGVSSATASNLLDDYEEGTYAPTVTDENGGSYGLSTNSDTLQYTKIGRKVTLQGMIAVTSESSPNGTLRLSLPFTAPSLTDDTDFALYAMGIANNGSTIAGQKFLFVQPGSHAFLYAIGDDGATNYIGHDEVDTNFQFHVNLSYVVS
jgi:hypothetical protein